MSFFVSSEIKNRVDENCLIASDSPSTIDREFILKISETVLSINKVEFSQGELFECVKIECNCNIHAIDKLFTPAIDGRLIFKDASIIIRDVQIEKIFKKDSDNYIVEIFARKTS